MRANLWVLSFRALNAPAWILGSVVVWNGLHSRSPPGESVQHDGVAANHAEQFTPAFPEFAVLHDEGEAWGLRMCRLDGPDSGGFGARRRPAWLGDHSSQSTMQPIGPKVLLNVNLPVKDSRPDFYLSKRQGMLLARHPRRSMYFFAVHFRAAGFTPVFHTGSAPLSNTSILNIQKQSFVLTAQLTRA
jgi:hypothetical protein